MRSQNLALRPALPAADEIVAGIRDEEISRSDGDESPGGFVQLAEICRLVVARLPHDDI